MGKEIKILCISDIHGNRKAAEKILLNENYDFAISAGDTELSDEWVNKFFKYAVAGNNDFHSGLPDSLTIELKNFRIFLTHGHIFGSYFTLMNYEKMLKQTSHLKNIDLFVNGHTHFPLYHQRQNNQKAFINPGSITYPRFGSNYSYTIITIDTDNGQITNVLFKNPYE